MISQQVKAVLEAPDTPATVLLVIAADSLGPDMFGWDPETIKEEMSDLLGKPLPAQAYNRLMAGIELVATNGFYKDLPTFIRVCHALVLGILVVEEFVPADAEEVACGITEAMVIWPPDPKEESPFCEQIVGYIGAVLKNEGIMKPPDVLRLGEDPGIWQNVQGDFADDPTMFNAIYGVEKDKSDAINEAVKGRLRKIMGLLEDLPLDVGSAKNAVKRMFSALGREQQSGQEMKPNVGTG
jgi:hypothetical protein